MRILTNMAFWQSRTWTAATDSLYPLAGLTRDPEPWSPIRQAWALYRRRRAYDAVVTMGIRESLAYGLLCALTGQPSRQVMCEAFIDDDAPASPLWRLKTLLQRWVFRRALGILTNSRAEIETNAQRFQLPPARFRYVPLHTNLREPARAEANDGFVLSAGRTQRDYELLLQAAPALARPIHIVCGADDLRDARLPSNVMLFRERPRAEYLAQLSRCAVVALPLRATPRATGQVVLLEAMALGKPVVTTRAPGTVDYVRPGENGLLVETGDAAGLAREVNRLLNDPALARRLGDQALADVQAHYTIEQHAAAKLAAVRDLLAQV